MVLTIGKKIIRAAIRARKSLSVKATVHRIVVLGLARALATVAQREINHGRSLAIVREINDGREARAAPRASHERIHVILVLNAAGTFPDHVLDAIVAGCDVGWQDDRRSLGVLAFLDGEAFKSLDRVKLLRGN